MPSGVDFRTIAGYSFDPTAYCRALRARVESGELSWDQASAMWKQYAASVDSQFINMPPLGPCSLGADSERVDLQASSPVASPYPTVDDIRDTFNPAPQFNANNWGDFSPEPPTDNWVDTSQFEEPVRDFDFPLDREHSGEAIAFQIEDDHRSPTFVARRDAKDSSGASTARPTVVFNSSQPQMLYEASDGVFRAMQRPTAAFDAPETPLAQDLSPYMTLPVGSAFSIKGECGCQDCGCGGQ